MADDHELLNISPLLKGDRDDSSSSKLLKPTVEGVGTPEKPRAINFADCSTIAVVVICAVVAILVVSPSLDIAASLQFENQIIVIGLLLGIMQICQQRIAQRLLLALEARSKNSTIHNLDGLLRWSFLTRHFAWTWRIVLLILMALPLVLSVLYKKFIGGVADTTSHTATLGAFRPGALPGVINAGPITTFLNKTNAFIIASSDDSLVPTVSEYPRAYGSSLLLISDGIAASLDEPVNIVETQRSLPARSALYFSADVRGTVSTYNNSVETRRSDKAFWTSIPGDGAGSPAWPINGDTSCQFQLDVQRGSLSDPYRHPTNRSDQSYAILGGFPGVVNNSISIYRDELHKAALLFITLRYNCHGKWRLTRSSFDLVYGNCSSQPLPMAFQYTRNAKFEVSTVFQTTLGEILGPFASCGARNGSAWYRPSAAAMVVTAYSAMLGTSLVSPSFNGSQYTPAVSYNLTTQDGITGGSPVRKVKWTVYDMSYQPTNIQMYLEVPTLQAAWGLYVVVLVQPFIIVVAFVFLILLRNTPISAGFGLVSILAGVDTKSLEILKGASFSGELSKKVGMAISVVEDSEEGHGRQHTIQYTVGETGYQGRIQNGIVYS